ncbi:MAG: MATE family efflux transporter [Gammaproteobacteria bacterium]|nr:MATE family efflux transporter [Gammaproteobacteria bacterium]
MTQLTDCAIRRSPAPVDTCVTATPPIQPAPNGAHAQRVQAILHGNPFPLLVRMASPNSVAFFVQASVSMVEVWYVGQLGTVSLAAMALVFPLLMLMQMVAGGALGGAVNSAVARAMGAAKSDRVALLTWHTIGIAAIGSSVFLGLFLLFGKSFLIMLGGTDAVLEQALTYTTILFFGSLGIWLNALLSGVYRGMGDMKFPAAVMVGGACLQVPLSGALILGWFGAPALGISGAAISVVLVSTLNSIISLIRLTTRHVAVPLTLPLPRFSIEVIRDIMRVGLPSLISPVVTVLTIVTVTGLIARIGTPALAGYGIGSRLEFLMIPLVFGLGAAMTSMVGINVGAGNYPRAERIGWLGGGTSAALTGMVGLLLAVFPNLWVSVFTNDPLTVASGASYLRIVGPAYLFLGLGLSLFFASQGAGAVGWPIVATIARFVISVGGAAAAVVHFGLGLDAIYICIAIAMVVYGAVTALSVHLGAWRPR